MSEPAFDLTAPGDDAFSGEDAEIGRALRASLDHGHPRSAAPQQVLVAVAARCRRLRRRRRRRSAAGAAAVLATGGVAIALLAGVGDPVAHLPTVGEATHPGRKTSAPTAEALLPWQEVNSVIRSQRPTSALQRGTAFLATPSVNASTGMCGHDLAGVRAPAGSQAQSWDGWLGGGKVVTTEQIITWPDRASARTYVRALAHDATTCRDSGARDRAGHRVTTAASRSDAVSVLTAPTALIGGAGAPTPGAGGSASVPSTETSVVDGRWSALALATHGVITVSLVVTPELNDHEEAPGSTTAVTTLVIRARDRVAASR